MSGTDGFETLLFEVVEENIARLTFARPDKKNAMNTLMRDEIGVALTQIRSNRNVRVLIIGGAGDTFCAGGDIAEMKEGRHTADSGRRRLMDMLPIAMAMYTLEIPVIAAVDGFAYGAGFNIALAADFILATPEARMSQSFGRVGLVPDFAGHFILPRIVGIAKAKELMFTARELTAHEALDMGIVYRVVERGTLQQAALEMARHLKEASPEAIAQSKQLLNTAFQLDLHSVLEREASAQGICLASDYHAEAIDAFLNRRPPRFAWTD